METFKRKQNRFHPLLKNRKYKFLYLVLDIYLGIGVLSLFISILYLLMNLDRADIILHYCVPGFVVFLSSAIFYLIGYQTTIWNKKSNNTDL